MLKSYLSIVKGTSLAHMVTLMLPCAKILVYQSNVVSVGMFSISRQSDKLLRRSTVSFATKYIILLRQFYSADKRNATNRTGSTFHVHVLPCTVSCTALLTSSTDQHCPTMSNTTYTFKWPGMYYKYSETIASYLTL